MSKSENIHELTRTIVPVVGITIYTVHELAVEIVKSLNDCDVLTIDLSHVTEIDSAGIQLLVATKKEVEKHNKTLRLIGHSSSVMDILDIYSLSSFFKDPIIMQQKASGDR